MLVDKDVQQDKKEESKSMQHEKQTINSFVLQVLSALFLFAFVSLALAPLLLLGLTFI